MLTCMVILVVAPRRNATLYEGMEKLPQVSLIAALTKALFTAEHTMTNSVNGSEQM